MLILHTFSYNMIWYDLTVLNCIVSQCLVAVFLFNFYTLYHRILAHFRVTSRIILMCSNCRTISQVVALTVVSLRIAVATVTDLQFHPFGACVALAWIIPSAVNKILWCSLQQQENRPVLAYATAHNFETVFLQIFFLISYY